MVDTKQASSLATSIGSFLFGDNIDTMMKFQENITVYLQNIAFLVSIIAGLVTIYYTMNKHGKKNSGY